jgi:hypothetical protein
VKTFRNDARKVSTDPFRKAPGVARKRRRKRERRRVEPEVIVGEPELPPVEPPATVAAKRRLLDDWTIDVPRGPQRLILPGVILLVMIGRSPASSRARRGMGALGGHAYALGRESRRAVPRPVRDGDGRGSAARHARDPARSSSPCSSRGPRSLRPMSRVRRRRRGSVEAPRAAAGAGSAAPEAPAPPVEKPTRDRPRSEPPVASRHRHRQPSSRFERSSRVVGPD